MKRGYLRRRADRAEGQTKRRRRRRRRPVQMSFAEVGRGGRREGAGRPRGPNPKIPHRARVVFGRMTPVHVTVKMAPHVYNLRSRRSFRVIERALYHAAHGWEARLIQFSVQGNHIHLLIEAPDQNTLSTCVQRFSIRTAKGLNRMMNKRGRVFADRYHAHLLRTPTEARRARTYLRVNALKHAIDGDARGSSRAAGWVDPYSSDAAALSFALPRPATWLMRTGWRRGKDLITRGTAAGGNLGSGPS